MHVWKKQAWFEMDRTIRICKFIDPSKPFRRLIKKDMNFGVNFKQQPINFSLTTVVMTLYIQYTSTSTKPISHLKCLNILYESRDNYSDISVITFAKSINLTRIFFTFSVLNGNIGRKILSTQFFTSVMHPWFESGLSWIDPIYSFDKAFGIFLTDIHLVSSLPREKKEIRTLFFKSWPKCST